MKRKLSKEMGSERKKEKQKSIQRNGDGERMRFRKNKQERRMSQMVETITRVRFRKNKQERRKKDRTIRYTNGFQCW